MKNRVSSLLGGAVSATLISVAVSTQADPVTYYVNPTLSSLTLSGIFIAVPYQQQVSGSLVDSWGGTITGDLTGGVLTFDPGTSISAYFNPVGPFVSTPYVPSPNVGNDAYGVYAAGNAGAPYGVVIANTAYRNLTFLLGGTATDGVAPTAMTLAWGPASRLDYGVYSITLGAPIAGGPSQLSTSEVVGPNNPVGLASLGYDEVTLPVTIQAVLYATVSGNPTQIAAEQWTGTIVAEVPEPSAIALALVGLGLFVARARARRV